MALDNFITGALPEPTGGIALLILLIYAITFLLQRYLGQRLPNEGEISTIALSLTAFVLSTYMLIASWNTSSEAYYSLGIAHPLHLISHQGQVPLIGSLGVVITPLISILTTFFSAAHFLFMIGISLQLPDRDQFAHTMAYCNLFILSILLLLFSPDLPIIFLGTYLGSRALKKLEKLYQFSQKSLGFFALDKGADIAIISAICFIFIKYRIWHETIFPILSVQLSLENIEITLASTSLVRQSTTLGFNFLILILLASFFIKTWLLPLRLWKNTSESQAGNFSLWGYSVLFSIIGLYILLRWSQFLPENVRILFVIIGGIASVYAALRLISTWYIHHFLRMYLILQAGYISIVWGIGHQTPGLLMLIGMLTTGLFAYGISAIISGNLHHRLQKFGLTIYHPQEAFMEKISSGDIRHMRGLRKEAPSIFWIYTFSLACIIGLPFSLQYPALMELFDHLYTQANVFSLLSFSIISLTSLVLIWGVGRQWILLATGENIISRIQKSKISKPSVWEEARDTQSENISLSWRLLAILLTLGLPNLSFWLGASPLNMGKSWMWELFLEKPTPPYYWLHLIWLALGLLTFVIATRHYRNKNVASLFRQK